MKCFVINLDREPHRLRHIKGSFDRLRLPFERVPAVDARALGSEELAAFRLSHPHETHWRGHAQIGIFLSHLATWRRIADLKIDAAAIFEDDVHIAQSARFLLENDLWISRLPTAVRLETTMQGLRLQKHDRTSVGDFKLYGLQSAAWGAAAYIVNRAAAVRLAATLPAEQLPVDYMLFDRTSSRIARELRLLQVAPAPCVQDQYLPARHLAHDFACETAQTAAFSMGKRSRITSLAKPIVRYILNKTVVPFDSATFRTGPATDL